MNEGKDEDKWDEKCKMKHKRIEIFYDCFDEKRNERREERRGEENEEKELIEDEIETSE
jgi:hypothetical protein